MRDTDFLTPSWPEKKKIHYQKEDVAFASDDCKGDDEEQDGEIQVGDKGWNTDV